MKTRTLILASLLMLAGLVVVAEPAAAMCYYDPEDPVGSAMCGVRSTVRCVQGTIDHTGCPV